MDQLTADVPSFRHTWRKELEEASFPESNLHFLIEEYLLDYRVFRGTKSGATPHTPQIARDHPP